MRKAKPFIIAALLIAVGIGFLFLPIRQWFIALQPQIEQLGWLGPIVVTLAYIVMTVLLIPGSALTLGAGLLFGFKIGLLVVLVGANGGALCSFLLARTALRDRVAQWATANPKFAALDRAIGQNGFKMVFLSRLSPAFPFTLLNYLLGLTTVRTGTYVLANLLGMLPGTFLYVYLAASAREALAGTVGSGATVLQNVLKVAGLLATIAVVIIVTRIARKAMAEASLAESEKS